MKRILLAITLLAALPGCALLKPNVPFDKYGTRPLPGVHELACKQFIINASGDRKDIYFRTSATMDDWRSAIDLFNAGGIVRPGLEQLFDIQAVEKNRVTTCIQVEGPHNGNGRFGWTVGIAWINGQATAGYGMQNIWQDQTDKIFSLSTTAQ